MLVLTSSQCYETLDLVTIEKYREYLISYYINKEIGYVYCEAVRDKEVIHDYRTAYRKHDEFQSNKIIQAIKENVDVFETLEPFMC